MNKRKGQSQNPLAYWWNEFLFARYYEYKTDLSPEELAEELRNLAHKRQGWIWGLEKTTKIDMHPNEKGMDFNLVSKRKRLLDPIGITTASSHGTAKVDSATGNTLVEGSVRLGRFFHVFLLIYVAVIVGVYLPLMLNAAEMVGGIGTLLGMTSPILIIALVFAGLWWRIYRDRNNLASLIEEVVFTEKAKRSADRLSEQDEGDNNWFDDADEAQSSRKNL